MAVTSGARRSSLAGRVFGYFVQPVAQKIVLCAGPTCSPARGLLKYTVYTLAGAGFCPPVRPQTKLVSCCRGFGQLRSRSGSRRIQFQGFNMAQVRQWNHLQDNENFVMCLHCSFFEFFLGCLFQVVL